MNIFKSHVTFSREHRRGIFLLLTIIVLLQCVYFFVLPRILGHSNEGFPEDSEALAKFTKEIDSLKFDGYKTLFPYEHYYTSLRVLAHVLCLINYRKQ